MKKYFCLVSVGGCAYRCAPVVPSDALKRPCGARRAEWHCLKELFSGNVLNSTILRNKIKT
jgi:hypothetical protein